jgi:hypothetical protein
MLAKWSGVLGAFGSSPRCTLRRFLFLKPGKYPLHSLPISGLLAANPNLRSLDAIPRPFFHPFPERHGRHPDQSAGI